jgi:hypothetical protein
MVASRLWPTLRAKAVCSSDLPGGSWIRSGLKERVATAITGGRHCLRSDRPDFMVELIQGSAVASRNARLATPADAGCIGRDSGFPVSRGIRNSQQR